MPILSDEQRGGTPMPWGAFAAGFLGGLTALAAAWLLRTALQRLQDRLEEDDRLLLRAARAASGRLIFRADPLDPATVLLELKELPQQGGLPNRGQVQRLLRRDLLRGDPSGLAGRYQLTPRGWSLVGKLPALETTVVRPGAWFNSVSRRPLRR